MNRKIKNKKNILLLFYKNHFLNLEIKISINP